MANSGFLKTVSIKRRQIAKILKKTEPKREKDDEIFKKNRLSFDSVGRFDDPTENRLCTNIY